MKPEYKEGDILIFDVGKVYMIALVERVDKNIYEYSYEINKIYSSSINDMSHRYTLPYGHKFWRNISPVDIAKFRIEEAKNV